MKRSRSSRPLVALTALGALTVVALGGGATASTSSKGATVIKMERDGKKLFFTAPETVEVGANLKVKNKTNPRQVGSHTFSLVAPRDIPTEPKAIKKCAKKSVKICGAVVQWHEVDLETGEIGENPVEVGKQGWDRQGNLTRKGDSWVAERKGQSFARGVTAKPGKVLNYLCAVHPEMQGAIEVVE